VVALGSLVTVDSAWVGADAVAVTTSEVACTVGGTMVGCAVGVPPGWQATSIIATMTMMHEVLINAIFSSL
jgi:hypothetical protein